MRFCEISLPEKAEKVCAKKPCLRSREMMPGSSVMPPSALAMVAFDTPLARASLRNSSSQRSKLPVFLQLGSFGLAALLGSMAAAGREPNNPISSALTASRFR